jgi:hypothetical protein
MPSLPTEDDVDVLEELASLPSFYHPTVSPDGSKTRGTSTVRC